MTLFHTDPNAAADAKPDAETFQVIGPTILPLGWYWSYKCPRTGANTAPNGPFASRALAIADAQTGGREGGAM